jgi:AraC-like DNA-binding protein
MFMPAIYQHNHGQPFRAEPDLHVMFWGKEDCVPGHSVGPGIRDVYKVHFVHRGKGLVLAGGNRYELTQGHAFFMYPGYVYAYEADREEPWSYSWVAFTGAHVESIMARTQITPKQPVFRMDWRLMPGLYDHLTQAASHENSHDLRLKSVMYDFLSVVVETAPLIESSAARASKQEQYVSKGRDFLHAHYGEDISIRQLASTLGLDRKYVSALFRDTMGMPPQQYLLHYRMDRACELLQTRKYTVSEVARSVGYQDVLLFSKMFKKVKGVSPSKYVER